jgi:hypothetical protein
MQRDANLECDDQVYLDSFKPTLMDVFYDWSLGKSFAEVNTTHEPRLARSRGVQGSGLSQ